MRVSTFLGFTQENIQEFCNRLSLMFGISGTYTQRANTVIGPDGRFIFKKPCSGSADIPVVLEDIKALKN